MARHEEIQIPAATWTQITDSDVTAITFQNKSKYGNMYVQATSNETAPTGVSGFEYGSMQGEYNLSMAEGFPGIDGAVRVWAYLVRGGEVFVSHA